MSVIERIAEGALAAEEPDELSAEEQAFWAAEALSLAKSTLSHWFPVTWQVVDHNLPVDRTRGGVGMVVAAPVSDEDEPEPDLHFVLTNNGGSISVWVAHPAAVAVHQAGGTANWGEAAEPIQRAADVGRILRARKAGQS